MFATPEEINAYINDLKAGKGLYWGDADPDPYGGGAHWRTEFFYHSQQHRIFSVECFWPSQYHPEPEKPVWKVHTIAEFKKIVANQHKSKINFSFWQSDIKRAFDEYEKQLAAFEEAKNLLDVVELPARPACPVSYDDYKSLFAKAKSD